MPERPTITLEPGPPPKHNLIDENFGRWTVESFAGRRKGKAPYWNCRCSCGKRRPVAEYALKSGDSKACKGCRDPNALLWPRIKKKLNGCWEWQGRKDKDGYGTMALGGRPHRFAYEASFGPIPSGLYVLHNCDNRACCNPAHLYLGTAKDNADDCKRKGRHCHGSKHGCARITEADVRRMRRLHAKGKTAAELTEIFPLRKCHIYQILQGKSWSHVTQTTPSNKQKRR